MSRPAVSSRERPEPSAASTVSPTLWCAARNGMPSATRRSARYVAAVNPSRARSVMRSGRGSVPATTSRSRVTASVVSLRPGHRWRMASVPTAMALV